MIKTPATMAHGPRQRVFAVTGAVVGILGPLLLGLVTRHLSAGNGIAAFALYIALVIPFALYLWSLTRRTRCPQCQSEQARLVYDDRRAEYVACPGCGYREATGYSLAND